MMVRNWIGAVLTLIGIWLLYSAMAHCRRVLTARRSCTGLTEIGALPKVESPMFVFGEIMRPIILFGLGIFALKVTVAYFLLGAGRILSLFDLAGALFAIAAYGIWLSINTKFRMPDMVTARRGAGELSAPFAIAASAPSSSARIPVGAEHQLETELR